MNLNYKIVGNTDSESTIIFLHEGLGCIEMWKSYPIELCECLDVRGIIYDRSGYGKSQGDLVNRKADYLHLAAQELHEFLLYLEVENPIIYGHSDGGSIALIFAAKHPQIAKAIITEAAHVFNEDLTIQGVNGARPLIENGKMDALQKYHGDRYKEVFYAWNDIWLDDSFKNWSIEEEIKAISCPALIIQGEDDQYGSLKQVETILRSIGITAQAFTPAACGHAPFKEQKQQVIQKVIHFINEL